MSDLVELYRDSRTEFARLLTIGLQQQGVHATLVGEHLSNMIGAGLNLATSARVLVPAAEFEDAKAVLAVLMADQNAEPSTEGQPEACPACGAAWEPGFTVCWQCETPL